MRNRTLVTALVSALVLTPLLARDASACGMTACDGTPPGPMQAPPMPVKQSGENIVFVLDGQSVEVHIQIQYTGDPRRFGWIVPLQKPPTDIKPGSQAFFTNLLAGTVPTFQLTQSFDACANQPAAVSSSDSGFGCGSSASSGASEDTSGAAPNQGTGAGGSSASGQPPGPDVKVVRVGAFEVDLLMGGTTQGVTDWLTQNAYQVDPNANPIIEKYLSEGYMFAAVKLNAGETTKEIHPIVFRYPGTEPCVPLRLTSVAAEESMGVRAFFLGNDRVVPTTYKHVVLDEAAFDWGTTPGQNYEQVIGRAVATPTADGHAFVTDYYGPSNVVSQANLVGAAWSSSAFYGADPLTVPAILAQQGLALTCNFATCTSPHPLVMPLLEKWIPAPAGVSEGDFYQNIFKYKSQLVPGKWSADGFAKDFEERIVAPANHAVDLLVRWPNITRLYTTLSPALMTEDPIFEARPGLSQVPLAHTATVRTTCDQRQGVELSDGRHVFRPSPTSAWPPFPQDPPAALRVEDYSGAGPAMVLADNHAVIDGIASDWNAASAWPPPPQFRDAKNQSGCSVGRPRNTNIAIALGLLGVAGIVRRATRKRRGVALRERRERSRQGARAARRRAQPSGVCVTRWP